MFKKTFLSMTVASFLALSGCSDNDGEPNKGSRNEYVGGVADEFEALTADGRIYPVFNPALSQVPVPNDFIFDSTAGDGTFSDAAPGETNPVLVALGSLSGASTVAPIDIPLSGEVDPGTIDARAFMPFGTSIVPNPEQTVFVIELDYASGDPLQGLLAQETPTIPIALAAQNAANPESPLAPAAGLQLFQELSNPSFEATQLNLGGVWTLRITPTKPLKPKTRYVVMLTDGILDTQGRPIVQSPSYYNLTNEELPLASPTLGALRSLVNLFWESIGGTYLANLTNAGRPDEADLSVNNIALSYSFTTSGDEKVLEYIANPTEWFIDQLTTFVRLSAVGTVTSDLTGDGAVDYFDNEFAADAAVAGFPSDEIAAALGPVFAFPPPNGCQGLTGETAIACLSTVLATAPSSQGGFADLLPTPEARNVAVTSRNTPLAFVSAPASAVLTSATITPLVAQGTIDVPYYLGIPGSGDAITGSSWKADTTLAGAMNSAFASIGLALPQGTGASDVVNYIFPFPAQSDGDTTAEGINDLTIPWLAIYPDANCPMPYPTVIFQHGITTDRSAALSVGGVMAERCFATIAIDQVVHGVSPVSTEEKLGLAETLLGIGQENGLPPNLAPGEANNQAVADGTITLGFVMAAAMIEDPEIAQGIIDGVISGTASSGDPSLDAAIVALKSFEGAVANSGSTIPGIARTDHERHFGFTADASLNAVPMNFDESAAFGSSGSLYINLLGFLNSRDINRQGVVDLLNLRETLSTIDLNGDSVPDLDADNVSFMGHSLGTYTGATFVAIANMSPVGNITSASLLTPATGVVRMLENSPAFAPTVVGGLAGAGISQGSSSYEAFLNFFQAALDAVDPINFADNLNTSINFADHAFTSPSYYSSSYSRFQTSADDTGVLMIEIAGRPDANGNPQLGFASDNVNPIETETTQLTTQFGTALPTLLSGTEKLAENMGAVDVMASAPVDLASPDTILSRLSFGSHGMYVLPILQSGEEQLYGDGAAAEETRRTVAFIEGLTQSIAFFSAGGELADGAQLGGAIPDSVDTGLDAAAASAGVPRDLICASIGIGGSDANPCSTLEAEAQFNARTNQQLNL